MNKVSLIVITDGRKEYITQTINGLKVVTDYPFFEKIIVNDSGDTSYHQFLTNNFSDFKIVSHNQRRGLASAVQTAWSSYSPETEYIFHLEEDFLFLEEPQIDLMISLLKNNPYLIQMALVRSPVSHAEASVGGFVFQHLAAYVQRDGFFEHTKFFTLNPSVYPVSTTQIGWPDLIREPEADFTAKVLSLNEDYRFGYWGDIYDAPRVFHIGNNRSIGWRM